MKTNFYLRDNKLCFSLLIIWDHFGWNNNVKVRLEQSRMPAYDLIVDTSSD